MTILFRSPNGPNQAGSVGPNTSQGAILSANVHFNEKSSARIQWWS